MPSFVDQLEQPIEVDDLGTISVDVAFGGVCCALADVRGSGLEVSPDSARDMVDLGNRIRSAAREQVTVQNLEIPGFHEVEIVMFCDRLGPTGRIFKNGTVLCPGRMIGLVAESGLLRGLRFCSNGAWLGWARNWRCVR